MLELLEARVVPATRTFTGADFAADPQGLWSNPNNWANNAPPVNGDDVLIDASAANRSSTMNLLNLTLNSLTLDGGRWR